MKNKIPLDWQASENKRQENKGQWVKSKALPKSSRETHWSWKTGFGGLDDPGGYRLDWSSEMSTEKGRQSNIITEMVLAGEECEDLNLS